MCGDTIVADFYDKLAPYYHLIFEDWEDSLHRQAERLTRIIKENWGDTIRSVLDVSCGIGTQTIALAQKGYLVTASDISKGAIERARKEAADRGLAIDFSVCDMREVHSHYVAQFDLVISCDNSITHLLGDEEILSALRAMHSCVRAGGGCLITVRDYNKEERGRGLVKPYGVREENGKRYLLFQVWDFTGDQYDLSFYIIEDAGDNGEPTVQVIRSRYYAIGINQLVELMQLAGFSKVRQSQGELPQPVLVGTK
jgi:SAM-dependent methyltransferase